MKNENMFTCLRCDSQIEKPGLCSACMRLHDIKFKLFVFCVAILSLVCLYFYYIIYIDNQLGFLAL